MPTTKTKPTTARSEAGMKRVYTHDVASTPTDGGYEYTVHKHGNPVVAGWSGGHKRNAKAFARAEAEKLQREHDARMQAFYERTWREMFGEAG